MTRYQATTQHGHMSRVAGACLPTVASHRDIAALSSNTVDPRPSTYQPTNKWFEGRNLSGNREQKAVIT